MIMGVSKKWEDRTVEYLERTVDERTKVSRTGKYELE